VRVPLLALACLALVACGDDSSTPPTAAGPENDKRDVQVDRLREQGLVPGDLQRKLDEIQNRSAKPLTDADVKLFAAVYPEFVGAPADPEARRAILLKHKTDLISWSQIAARVGAAYAKIKSAPDIPGVNPDDVAVVRRNLAEVERAMKR
jgi:hypothetical protein